MSLPHISGCPKCGGLPWPDFNKCRHCGYQMTNLADVPPPTCCGTVMHMQSRAGYVCIGCAKTFSYAEHVPPQRHLHVVQPEER